MAYIIYDNDQPGHYKSAGHYSSGPNGSYALLIIVILFVVFFWADLGWLIANLDSRLRGNPDSTVAPNSKVMPNSRVMPVERSIITPITEVRYVTADNLNLREQPGIYAQAGYILPRGTEVALLGESHQEPDGDVWLKVRVETFEGPYVGWVNQQYVE
jgi:Bacterial SH3 domain